MNKLFKGNRYNFRILLSSFNQKQNFFAIRATHNRTKRTSFITTVNAILSGLDIPSDMPEFEESDWFLNKVKANRLVTRAERLLSDKEFILYLETYLDLDREQSEWENYENH